MNISQYKLLCKTCDSILEKNKSIYRVAIPLLHVIREHPFVLKQYQSIFRGNSETSNKIPNDNSFFSRLYKRISSAVTFERLSFENINDAQIDIVFVSHLVSAEHLDLKDDFYFSDIPRYLKSKGINSLVMLINHTDESASSISKKIKKSEISRVIIPKRLGWIRELKALVGLIKELITMRKESDHETGFLRNNLRFFSSFHGSSGALFGLRVSSYIQLALNRFKPVAIMTIYEGHAWERLAYNVAAKKNILRIGYQHSVVTQHSHAMCRSLGINYDPDIIYTAGRVTNEHLKRELAGSHSKVITLGSNKLLNIAQILPKKTKLKTCLVIPEGLYDECKILFTFTLQCANRLPDINFIWRLHPQLSFSEVLNEVSLSREDLPKNITVSNLSLIEDIGSATHVIYRGSTAVVEAIYGGLKPIYLSDGSDMTIDLLYDIDDGRKIVYDFDGFASAISERPKDNIENFKRYCEEYFTQLDSSILVREIEAIKN